MRYYYNLSDLVPSVPYVKQGSFNGCSFVLFGASSYKSGYFNKVTDDKSIKYYKKFKPETTYPNINFQKMLSQTSCTFSFDRPTDLLNHNLYTGTKYDYYVASKDDLTIRGYGKFVKQLLEYHNVSPPYVLVGVSEGCYDLMCFVKCYPELVKSVFWIDGGILGKELVQYENFRGNKKWHYDMANGKFWKPKINGPINTSKKHLQKIDKYNFNIKCHHFLKSDDLLKIPKSIPIHICWSAYFDFNQNTMARPKKIINIKKNYTKTLKNKYGLNVTSKWFEGPHCLERVMPITLTRYIVKNI